ncbi:MAG: hypothetical protein EOP04_30845 [Proteobacteria bacterium]|nr:MAG: hypothetical protein EOP04_30845 [Pseudomonadota bacterium]
MFVHRKIKKAGLVVSTQVALPMVYEEIFLDVGYRIDLLVEHKVMIYHNIN